MKETLVLKCRLANGPYKVQNRVVVDTFFQLNLKPENGGSHTESTTINSLSFDG